MDNLEARHYWNRHHLQQLGSLRNRREAKALERQSMPRAAHYAADHERRAHRWILRRLPELMGVC